ncbi:MAG: site-specific integrase [Candidatus Acidiferrum sp.]|jgi:integrase/recombinase XerD
MLIAYRRHNPARCKFTSRSDYRCKCPIWVTGTDAKGKPRREASKMRDWTKAQELIRKWDVEGAQPKRNASVTISDWRENFLGDAESRHLGEETIRKYKLLFSQLSAFADRKGSRFADDLDLDDLTEFRSSWNDAALSSSKKLERLRSIYRFAVSRKWVETNIAAELKSPKIKSAPTLPFSDDEMKKIFDAARESNRFAARSLYVFILVMRYAGLRISDTATLAKESLDGKRLHLYTAKTGEPVVMPLPEFVVKALASIERESSKFYFWSGESKIPGAVSLWRKRLARVFEDAGIQNGHSHRFRATFAVALLQAGTSIEVVSRSLGHQSLKITEKHYNPWVRTRQEALEKALENLLVEEPA